MNEEKMLSIYKKECRIYFVFFVLISLLGHTSWLYFGVPELTELTIFGFPAHYFLSMFLGWIGMLVAMGFFVYLSEKVEADIEAYNQGIEKIQIRIGESR